MSRITGLNDSNTLKKKSIFYSITVWKGEKQTAKAAGKNLNNLFRIEVPEYLKPALRNIGYQERNGSLYTEQINLVPACDDKLLCFDSKMTLYNASQPIQFCDRSIIHTKFILDEQNYVKPKENNETCPVAGTNHKCPHGCVVTGDFYFYIWELLDKGFNEVARLQVHGIKDNQNIANFLDQTKANIGSIFTSPFTNQTTKFYIIYKLTRQVIKSKFPIIEAGKRTAKRGTKKDWIVNLNFNPIWLNRYNNYQQVKMLQAANHQPSMRLIEQVHGTDYIQSASEKAAIAPSLNLEEYKVELAEHYKNNSWTKDGWQAMMLDTFKTKIVNQDLDLELLKAIAASDEERDKWCEF